MRKDGLCHSCISSNQGQTSCIPLCAAASVCDRLAEDRVLGRARVEEKWWQDSHSSQQWHSHWDPNTPVISPSHHHLPPRKTVKNNSCLLALSASGDPTVMGAVKHGPRSIVTNERIKRTRGKFSEQCGLVPKRRGMGPHPSHHCSKHKVTDKI